MKPFVLPIVLLILVGCGTVQVSQDYDLDPVLASYDTWTWREAVQPETGDLRIDNPLLDKRIRQAVHHHLTKRNIRHDAPSADVVLTYRLVIEQKIRGGTYPAAYGMSSYASPWYGGIGYETNIYQYDQCRLTIDLVAVETDALVWRGVGTYMRKDFKTPQDAARAMQKIVDRILGQFPPSK